jgi:hypothetical protein
MTRREAQALELAPLIRHGDTNLWKPARRNMAAPDLWFSTRLLEKMCTAGLLIATTTNKAGLIMRVEAPKA